MIRPRLIIEKKLSTINEPGSKSHFFRRKTARMKDQRREEGVKVFTLVSLGGA